MNPFNGIERITKRKVTTIKELIENPFNGIESW